MKNLAAFGRVSAFDRRISILLADEDSLTQAALAAFLGLVKDFEVIGQATDGRKALAMAQNLQPDVAVVDVVMPSLNGIELTALMRKKELRTAVVILTGQRDPEIVARAMASGASGFLLKSSAPEELEVAVRAARSGKRYVTPDVSEVFLTESFSASGRSELEPLTLRHREVLQLVVEGKASKEIASDLSLSVKTVEKHRAQLIRRCRVHNTAELIACAIRRRLIPGFGAVEHEMKSQS